MALRRICFWIVAASGMLMLSACTDGYEERGLCSYLGTCEMGLASDIDVNYCKELGSCDDGVDHTTFTSSGKPVPTSKESGGKSSSEKGTSGGGAASSGGGDSGGASASGSSSGGDDGGS